MARLHEEMAARGHATHESVRWQGWRTELPDNWDTFLAGLPKSRRTSVRNQIRKLVDTGRVRLRRAETAADVSRAFEILVDLHQKRRGMLQQPGCFASPSFTAFHRELAERFLADRKTAAVVARTRRRSDRHRVQLYRRRYGLLLPRRFRSRRVAVGSGLVDDGPVVACGHRRRLPIFRLSPRRRTLQGVVERDPSAAGRTARCRPSPGGTRATRGLANRRRGPALGCPALAIAAARGCSALGGAATAGRTHLDLAGFRRLLAASGPGSARARYCRWSGTWLEEGAHERLRDDCKRRQPAWPANRRSANCAPAAWAPITMPRSPTASGDRPAGPRSARSPIMVLFYHRIAATQVNPWTTSPRVFERQMAWLKRNFDLVSLEEAQRRIASGKNRRPAVSITFDDGYADNCDHGAAAAVGSEDSGDVLRGFAKRAGGPALPARLGAAAHRWLPTRPTKFVPWPMPASRLVATPGVTPTWVRFAIRKCCTKKWSAPVRIWKR